MAAHSPDTSLSPVNYPALKSTLDMTHDWHLHTRGEGLSEVPAAVRHEAVLDCLSDIIVSELEHEPDAHYAEGAILLFNAMMDGFGAPSDTPDILQRMLLAYDPPLEISHERHPELDLEYHYVPAY